MKRAKSNGPRQLWGIQIGDILNVGSGSKAAVGGSVRLSPLSNGLPTLTLESGRRGGNFRLLPRAVIIGHAVERRD